MILREDASILTLPYCKGAPILVEEPATTFMAQSRDKTLFGVTCVYTWTESLGGSTYMTTAPEVCTHPSLRRHPDNPTSQAPDQDLMFYAGTTSMTAIRYICHVTSQDARAVTIRIRMPSLTPATILRQRTCGSCVCDPMLRPQSLSRTSASRPCGQSN